MKARPKTQIMGDLRERNNGTKLTRRQFTFDELLDLLLEEIARLEVQAKNQQKRAQESSVKRMKCCGTRVPRPGVTHVCSTTNPPRRSKLAQSPEYDEWVRDCADLIQRYGDEDYWIRAHQPRLDDDEFARDVRADLASRDLAGSYF